MAAPEKTMSGADVAWLRMDDPTNLMMITGVLTFEEPLDYDRVCTIIEERLLRFDRFGQRVAPSRIPLALPHWEDDPDFDLTHHVRRAALPEPGDQATLQAFVSDWMSVPLDRQRPLWQFHLIENYGQGSALLARLHHSIADGIALMRVLLSLTDDSREATWNPQESGRRRPRTLLGRALTTAQATWQLTGSLFQESVEALRQPERLAEVARLGASGVGRLAQILVRWPDPQTLFKGPLGVPKRATWSQPVSLDDVKAVGKVTGGTVNDILLTAVAGALRRYLLGKGEAVDDLHFHAVVPVNLRPLDGPIELGNKFGLVFLSLPIGISDQIERLEALKRHMDELKRSPEAMALYALLNTVGMAPTEIEDVLLNIFGTKATGVMTNVPGPRRQLYLAGSPLREIMFWVPQSGRLGLGVSILSYNGNVLLGIATDAGLVPDPELIVEGFHREFAEMMALVEMVRADDHGRPSAKSEAQRTAGAMPLRCRAQTKSGQRCRNRAQEGSNYCHVHDR